MTYERALAYIASLEPRGWRFGLDRMAELIARAGLEGSMGQAGGPQYIHVAGTNGKGSVTAFVQSMLVESGYRTGAFFSPFVYEPRERVQFGRHYIPKSELARLTAILRGPADSLEETPFGGATEFEFKTALGFQFWAEKKCDWVALEVGLGGKLDSTNVVTPRCSVIVSIGLDHVAILGETYAEIAGEKAGIIKPGVPVILGSVPPEAEEIITEKARSCDSQLWRFGKEIRLESRPDRSFRVQTPLGSVDCLVPGIPGTMQPHNMALAIAAMQASGAAKADSALRQGAMTATVPGRFERAEYRGITTILDGAHNAEAAEVLRDTLDLAFPGRKVILITGMVSGHDPARFYRPIADKVISAKIVPIDFHRAVDPRSLAEILQGVLPNVKPFESIDEALKEGAAEAGEDDLLLVTGSFYLVGEVGRLLIGRRL